MYLINALAEENSFMERLGDLVKMENLFLALSDKTRLRILNLMREKEVCVFYFTEVLGESQPKISRHLAYLRGAEIVSARRDGKWIYYKIEIPKNEFAANILYDTLDWLKSQAEMRQEYSRLFELISSDSAEIDNRKFFEVQISAETNVNQEKEELPTFLL